MTTYPKHWTYSRLSTFEKCPRQYAAQYLAAYPTFKPVQHPALARGNAIHELMEQAVVHKKRLTGALAHWNKVVTALRREWPAIECERKIGFTRKWNEYPGDWREPQVWLRLKMDFYGARDDAAKVIDWKTGNIYGDNADQVRLYAGVVMENRHELDVVDVELIYLDRKQGIAETITRDQWNDKKREFTDRAGTMLAARKFPPKPGGHCAGCAYSASRGGPCEEGVRDRVGLQTDSTRPIRVVAAQAPRVTRRRPGPGLAGTVAALDPDRVQAPGNLPEPKAARRTR